MGVTTLCWVVIWPGIGVALEAPRPNISRVSEERSKRIHAIIEQMGAEVRKELDAARKKCLLSSTRRSTPIPLTI